MSTTQPELFRDVAEEVATANNVGWDLHSQMLVMARFLSELSGEIPGLYQRYEEFCEREALEEIGMADDQTDPEDFSWTE